ncbi:uncharacterized protein LOC123872198 [Maniola jurtina]|uniref:uncharacterized protein LOC123872198 n=1 Tax=Maniola jurtina TaxID=191418 RepID=UPI001E68F918|nr:uncharacterized protein LOC123872198 [Maniola jurtina]XP_045772334.1 uncharacterized protein LOC123872198 [Maniola jurtina]XP_045772335.1 uncharacterized protein LOC123872198 [Maniola jurtina]
MEHAPQVQRDEQYPLLKVESGGGDNVMRTQLPSKIASTGWHVTCTPKQSWCSRWPEFVSACWMTTILLLISFLVFYALGMSAYRRQPVVIVRCNDSKPASDVFYHHIVSRDAYVPFSLYSEYISFMAKQYPLLHFNVYFLIDDSWQNSIQGSRHLRFLKRLVPQIAAPFNSIFGQNYKKEIKEFQRRYQNVNISVMYLSQYMAMTPLRYKWRIIPPNYLSFYARVYAIWQNGGIGFDLITFNDQFNQNRAIDRRVDTILQQHNDGIKSEKYADTFNSLDNQEESELFSTFFNIINQILNETSSFFGADSTDINVINNTPIVRTHRSKRDIAVNTTDISLNIEMKNHTVNENFNETVLTERIPNLHKMNISKKNSTTYNWYALDEIKPPYIYDIFNVPNISNFNVDMPQVLFYDIFGFSDEVGPSYSLLKTLAPPNLFSSRHATKQGQSKSKYVSLTPEGHFVAASSRHHPFLSHLLSSGCHRVSPQFAIKDTLLSQCSGFLRNDIYCENIRVIYNVV